MTENKKNLGFEIAPTLCFVYSYFDPATKEWDDLVRRFWGDKSLWPSPMSAGLNYGLSVFEGMKAFRHKSGEIFIFRPKDHAKRFVQSAEGLFMPAFPTSKFLDALQILVRNNAKYVPEYRQGSLYIRPIEYGLDKLGFAYNPEVAYVTAFWCTPVGNYYTEGLKPISVNIERDITRAMPHGVGYCKASGNYEISRKAQYVAKNKGCQDALFLDGKTKTHIEELGAANVFMIKDNIIYTPRMTDTILDGINRKSIITIVKSEGLEVCEQDITVEELLKADEVFACGTAAVITPIGKVKDGENIYTIGSGEVGNFTQTFYKFLTGIQYGDMEDKFRWLTKVEAT